MPSGCPKTAKLDSQSAYYAVSRVVSGQEDLSTFTSGNALQSAVAESVGTGAVVLQRVETPAEWNYISNPTLRYYTRWECPPTFNMPSTPLDYLIADPNVSVSPRPLNVSLHCWGGWLNGGYAWWYGAENGYVLVATNQVPYDWWTGSHENYGTADSFNVGQVYNYQQQRIISFIENFVKTQYTVDTNRILLNGISMGGSGASMWGVRAGDYFSYTNSWVGVHRPRYTPWFFSSFEAAYGRQAWHRPYYLTGTDTFDYFDNVLWLNANPTVETPYACFANGKNDSQIGWQQAVDYVNKLIEQKRPFKFYWDQSGHSCRSRFPGTGSDRYCGVDIAKNQPLPAFTHCSLDNNPGNGDPANGDAAGFINAYQVWETTGWVDTVNEFQMTCWLMATAPQSSCTTDFTPRRCQSFILTAGQNCTWQNTDLASSTVIQSGNLTADACGLATITGLTVSKTGNRIRIVKGGSGGDTTAPAAVSNLATSSPTSNSITLSWTAPGDDGSTGTATSYDIRYRTGGAVTDSNWASATQVTGEPTPAVAGTNQNMVVGGLSASTTYYFAIKTSDEVPNTSAISNSPSGTTTSGGGSGTGLRGEYFDNIDFTNLVLTRTDATVDFDWGNGSPHASVGYDSFSVRWTGLVQAQYSETYTFYTVSDDGVRLWVNGQQLVNNWTDHAPTENSSTIALTAGQLYDITMEYYENTSGAVARLLWSSASTPKATIPQVRLFPAGGGGDTTAPAAVSNLGTSSPTSSSITLSWTAPGDDGSTGTATSYDIRYRTGGAVNDSNWASATQVTGEPAPALAGTSQNMTVSGLSASTTYYFAMKTSDEVLNTSAISNSPSGTTTSGGGSGTGLRGEYYDNIDFTNLVLTRTDATVDFDWGNGTPHASIGVDSFSVRWTGLVQAQYSETYTFYTVSDDGVRLWVNGQQLVNNWTDHAPTENSSTIALTAGQLYDITMEYYENTSGAVARLLWSSASTPKAAIPQARLFPAG